MARVAHVEMDHFNMTVHNGAMVSTRKGLQITKQKHKGIFFVNSFPSVPNAAEAPGREPQKPLKKRLKFVSKQIHPRSEDPKASSPPAEAGRASRRASTHQRTARRRETNQGQTQVTEEKALFDFSGVVPACTSLSPAASSPDWYAEYKLRSDSPSTSEDSLDLAQEIFALEEAGPQAWPTQNIMSFLPERHRDLIARFLPVAPTKLYPFEKLLTYNPARSSEFYGMILSEPAAIYCLLMCGTIYESAYRGWSISQDLIMHVSNACSIVNRKLMLGLDKFDPVTLECTSTLALTSNLMGRHDHWHVHMKGLKRMVEVSGGLKKLRPSSVGKIRRTDVKGAMALATTPYLPFARLFPSITDVVSDAVRSHIQDTLDSVLLPAGISRVVVDIAVEQRLFMHAIDLAGVETNHLAFDPHAFVEQWLWIPYQLLCHPRPLREVSADQQQGPVEMPTDWSALQVEEDAEWDHRGPLTGPLANDDVRGLLERALRIAAILYYRELIPDYPHNLYGYSVLLGLLSDHLRRIVAAMRGEDGSRISGAAMCPALLWICLVGNLVSTIADTNEHRTRGWDRYDRTAYRACAAEALGGVVAPTALEAAVDALGDDDLALCRLFELGRIQGGGWEGEGRSERWDDKTALRGLLIEGL